jgi:cyclophilin family peptidyl-prolyl cis-trans isomerase
MILTLVFFAETAWAAGPVAVLETNMGEIRIELYQDKAPVSVKNFLAYLDEGYYDGTVFHRVVPGFVIQGGGYDMELKKKPTRGPIKNEAKSGPPNKRGAVAMARTMQPDSATSQFFINLADNSFLDHKDESPQGYGYAVFGKVVEGMEVVDAIGGIETGRMGRMSDVPLKPVVIERAYSVDPKE